MVARRDVIDELIIREGGFVDNPDDRGGPTKHGITQARLSDWRGRPVSVDEVRELSWDEARSIYLKMYATGLALIQHHEDLYRFVLDVSVLSGPGTAGRLVQSTLNDMYANIPVDGVIGPKTAAAIEDTHIPRLIQNMIVARIPALVRIVEGNASQLQFLEGWVTRTLAFLPEPA